MWHNQTLEFESCHVDLSLICHDTMLWLAMMPWIITELDRTGLWRNIWNIVLLTHSQKCLCWWLPYFNHLILSWHGINYSIKGRSKYVLICYFFSFVSHFRTDTDTTTTRKDPQKHAPHGTAQSESLYTGQKKKNTDTMGVMHIRRHKYISGEHGHTHSNALLR